MKARSVYVTSFICLFVGCQWIGYAPAPPVTLQMVSTSVRKGSHVDLTMLREGRRLFVHRCIECHTLPPLWRYGTEDWPEIVNSISHRASLKPAEREAVIAYILAVRLAER
jgi:mono/diheme cytochrome c family protein